MFSQFFKKLSLTQQVLLMILLFYRFFCDVFSSFISVTALTILIANQMYTTMASRQQPIVSLLKSNLLGAGDAYDAIYKALYE